LGAACRVHVAWSSRERLATVEIALYLAVEDIDHSRTKTKSPQTNGICERFHKTALNEFYRVAFRKKVYRFNRRAAGGPGRMDQRIQ
jgi:transposase InsO family protein